MGRPKTLTNHIIGFILENHEMMKATEMAIRLNIKVGTIRCFLAKNGLTKTLTRKSYFEDETADGCFNVDERDNWLTG